VSELIHHKQFSAFDRDIENCDLIASLIPVRATSGEVVAVFVVRKNPALTERDVIDHAKTALTGYKVPKHVYFRTELPKTNVGKILRRALRDELLRPASSRPA
jgi:acyl-coenzyme A synthetase/AMP-(fatty) acid ligase